MLADIPLLIISDSVTGIAKELLQDGVAPQNASDDAFHITR